MPIQKTPDVLTRLFRDAVAADETIRNRLAAESYDEADLLADVLGEGDRIWESVGEESRGYEQAESEVQAADAKWRAAWPPAPSLAATRQPVRGFLFGLLTLAIILYLLWLLGFGLYFFGWHWRSNAASLGSGQTWLRIGLYMAPLLAGFVLIGTLGLQQTRRSAEQAADLAARQQAWEKSKEEAKISAGLPELQAKLDDERRRLNARLAGQMTEEISAAINRRTAPSYAPVLAVERPRGFGEVSDGRFSIYTPARKRLQFLLDNLTGASIGIAGSRGAGKTTLIKSYCGPKRIVDTLNGKPVLGILASAPVAYQARDFLLYLFSAACQSVIEKEGGSFIAPVIAEDFGVQPGKSLGEIAELRRLPVALIRFGAGLLALGLAVSLLLAALPEDGPTRATTQGTATAPATVASGTPIVTKPAPPPGQASPALLLVAKFGDLSARWLKQMAADPGKLLSWGASFALLGLMASTVLHGNLRWTLVRAMPWLRLVLFFGNARRAVREQLKMEDGRIYRAPDAAVSRLRGEAESWLRTIKFQQSFTSGWSGSLKLPIGLEGGVNRAVTLAQNQLSLPEIGYFFARFIDLASAKYQVIIGIDELDKLATDELARQFINDIKSIFGLERCFYLVSVSENAMSSFERRGMPFRDEFDSAFDEVIYVEHLKFDLATKLLERRILGRPVAFFALSYCLSGGLPRDLIRSFRSILEIGKEQTGLAAICRQLLSDDIVAKARAIGTSARRINLEPEGDRLLEALHGIEAMALSDSALEQAADRMLGADFLPGNAGGVQAPAAPPGDGGVALGQLRELAEELATYILFVLALRRFFTDQLRQADLMVFIDSKDIDRMAEARRYLGVNPAITRTMIRAFNSAHLPAM